MKKFNNINNNNNNNNDNHNNNNKRERDLATATRQNLSLDHAVFGIFEANLSKLVFYSYSIKDKKLIRMNNINKIF